MAAFASAEKAPVELYKLMIGSVVPRPIAFVATKGADGIPNLAPFSFFSGAGYNPPTLVFSVIDRGEEMKDTSRNISERPEFIVHIVNESLAEAMNVTCADFGAHVDEFGEAGLTAVPGTVVDVPRVAAAPIAMECRMTHHLRLGNSPPRTSHILGEIIHWHFDDGLLDERGRVKADALKAVGRMGGVEYARTMDRFAIDRPVIPADDPRSIAAYQAIKATPPQG